MERYELEELKEICECMGIQLEKAKKSLDGLDNNFTEAVRAIDAIQFDFEQLKVRINNIEKKLF